MSRIDEKKILGVEEIKKNQKEDVFEIEQKLKVSDDKIDEGGFILKDDVNEIEENLRVDVFEIVEKLKIYNEIFNELNFGFMELKFEFINGKLIVIEDNVDQYLVLYCYGNFSCNDLFKVIDLEVLEGSNLEEFDKGGFIVIDFNLSNRDLGKVNVNYSEVQIEE